MQHKNRLSQSDWKWLASHCQYTTLKKNFLYKNFSYLNDSNWLTSQFCIKLTQIRTKGGHSPVIFSPNHWAKLQSLKFFSDHRLHYDSQNWLKFFSDGSTSHGETQNGRSRWGVQLRHTPVPGPNTPMAGHNVMAILQTVGTHSSSNFGSRTQ